jgi:hypothetical protein
LPFRPQYVSLIGLLLSYTHLARKEEDDNKANGRKIRGRWKNATTYETESASKHKEQGDVNAGAIQALFASIGRAETSTGLKSIVQLFTECGGRLGFTVARSDCAHCGESAEGELRELFDSVAIIGLQLHHEALELSGNVREQGDGAEDGNTK